MTFQVLTREFQVLLEIEAVPPPNGNVRAPDVFRAVGVDSLYAEVHRVRYSALSLKVVFHQLSLEHKVLVGHVELRWRPALRSGRAGVSER